MEWFFAILALLWLAGWIATMFDTRTDGNWFMRFVGGPVILFFIWPYVAWYMATASR